MPQAKVAERFPTASPAVLDALRALDLTAINVDLILQLVRRFVSSKEAEGGGGVLVFLPGSGEIDEVMRVLIGVLASPDGPVRAEWVIPLHGALPPHEQVRVFQPAPAGVTKLVLATNVAETSITINDIALVIDTGRVKRVRYDASTRMTRLDDVCISDAEARQRRGRAGRVRAGLCYHLFPSDAVLVPATEPEVLHVH
jgi:HrpA-like RNA helicase